MRDEVSSRFYELMVISVPDGTPEDIMETTASIGRYIEGAGGSVIRLNTDSPWGRRRLSYPIRHKSQDVNDGIYALYHFEIDPSRLPEVERDMKLNDNLMRHLLLQLSEEPVFPEPEAEETEQAEEPSSDEDSAEVEPSETTGDTDSEESPGSDEESDESQKEENDKEEDDEESSDSTSDEDSDSEEE